MNDRQHHAQLCGNAVYGICVYNLLREAVFHRLLQWQTV